MFAQGHCESRLNRTRRDTGEKRWHCQCAFRQSLVPNPRDNFVLGVRFESGGGDAGDRAHAAGDFFDIASGIGQSGGHDCPFLLVDLRGYVGNRVSWWPLLKRREIMRGDAVKYVAVR